MRKGIGFLSFAVFLFEISKAKEAAAGFNVYNDPECSRLREKAAELYGVDKEDRKSVV